MSGHRNFILNAVSSAAVAIVVAAPLFSFHAMAEPRYGREERHRSKEDHRGEILDSRYHHDRYYPARGRAVTSLAPGHRELSYRGARYYFHGGVWYRRSGPGFIVIAPPVGIVVPFLPPYYTVIRIREVPYYYANDVYYVRSDREEGYVVTEPPRDEVVTQSNADQLFIYPRLGQSEQQQASDRYECHRWAVGQTAFDPSLPLGGVAEDQLTQKRSDYQRAMGACLDGRGYTVK